MEGAETRRKMKQDLQKGAVLEHLMIMTNEKGQAIHKVTLAVLGQTMGNWASRVE